MPVASEDGRKRGHAPSPLVQTIVKTLAPRRNSQRHQLTSRSSSERIKQAKGASTKDVLTPVNRPTQTKSTMTQPKKIYKTKDNNKSQQRKVARDRDRREKHVKNDTLRVMCADNSREPKCRTGKSKWSTIDRPRPLSSIPSPKGSKESKSSSLSDRLHSEIVQYAKQTKERVEAMTVDIELSIDSVRSCVLGLWPESRVETYGSYSTGIWLPSSDVDLVILGVVDTDSTKQTVKGLRKLAKELEEKSWVESLVVLDRASIPILKLVSAETGVPIDITFESSSTHSGLMARDLVKRHVAELPELYPLAIVFKQLLRERELNDAYTGGLSSYSAVLMLVHFSLLRRHGPECFEAAALYASGADAPPPAILAKRRKERLDHEKEAKSSEKKDSESAETKEVKPLFEEKKAQTYSYADVASGIPRVPEEKAESKPVSYAAAVAAAKKAQMKNTTVTKASSPLKRPSSAHREHHSDVGSVTSSADTEDISSCSDGAASSADVEDEVVNLGELVLAVLEFFGTVFDYRCNGLSVRDGGYIYRLASPDASKPTLVIEDPINPDRNVAASSFAFAKVMTVFEDAYFALQYFRASKFTPTALGCLLKTQDLGKR